MKISKRLATVGKYTKGYNRLADIGCDHGYLAIYAVLNNYVMEALCCDINEGPLLQAEGNIKLYGLEEKIKTLLNNGIKSIDADIFTICGMGGILIKEIIEAGFNEAKKAKRLILAPNNESYSLRKFLITNGFMITNEEYVFDKKYYSIIVCHYAGVTEEYTNDELEYGKLLLSSKNTDLKAHLQEKLRYFTNILAQQNNEELKTKVEQIKGVIKKYYED